MPSWEKNGEVILRNGREAVDASELLQEFRDNGGSLTLQDGSSVRASRWMLTPLLIAEVVAGRATLSVEAKGGLICLRATDRQVLETGHVVDGGIWFPLEFGACSEVLSVLEGGELQLGPLSLKGLLRLKSAGLDKLTFSDRISEVSPEVFGEALTTEAAPTGITATLYPYQLTGWRWLQFLSRHEIGGLLADEMGLGKTLQLISLIADAGSTPLKPVLVVAPGTLLENWRRELARFAPAVKVLIHHGSGRTGSPRVLCSFDVIVTAYDTVVRDNGLLATVEWDAVILDEAQGIRNPGTARSAAVFSLKKRRGYAITGTPVENRLTDLWSIMKFVAPNYLGSLSQFKTDFADDAEGARKLEPLVSPLMLRRLVAEVAKDLPQRIDIDVPLLLPRAEAEQYERLRKQVLLEHGSAGPMVAITKLRQFCGHPLAAGIAYSDPENFPKLERLLEIAEEVFSTGQKAIVFSTFTHVSDLIISALRRRLGAWVDHLDGRVELQKRQEVIDAFTGVSGPAALVLNPKVAGAGLNITAATHVIHYGLEWNPALEAQASARAWRRGQDRPVTIHRLFFTGTVEEVMNERLQSKTELSGAAVVGVQGSDDDTRDALRALSLSPLSGAAE